MYKLLLLFILALSVTSCGYVDRKMAVFSGYSTICIEDVEYIQFTSGASVAYNSNGTIKNCKL